MSVRFTWLLCCLTYWPGLLNNDISRLYIKCNQSERMGIFYDLGYLWV